MSAPQIPAGFSITGGIPTKSQDMAASVIFTIAFTCLAPLAVWRLASKASRSTTMIRPTIFIPVRIATYIIRAIEANGNYDETLFIVEQVFLLAGFPIVCDAILSLLEYHITRTHTNPEQGQLTKRACRLLRLALTVALILGIVAGTKISDAMNDPDTASTVRTLRNVNAILCLAIVLGVMFVVLVAHVHKNLPLKPTALLVFMAGCLTIAGAYRLSSIHSSSSPLSVGTKAKFYFLLSLMEWLVTLALFVVNARVVFGEDLAKEKKEAAKRGDLEQVPMGTQGYKYPYAHA